MRIFLLLQLLLGSFLPLLAQKQDKTLTYLYDETSQPPEMFYDIQHLRAEILRIEPLKKYLETRSVYSFTMLRNRLDSIVFNIPECKISKVLLNDKTADYKQNGKKLIIRSGSFCKAGSKHELLVELSTECHDGMPSFTGWDDTSGTKRKQIWGFSLSNIFADGGVKHDLLTTELLVTFDSKYAVFSNGQRQPVKKNADGTSTHHYKLDRDHYFGLLVLVIGDYRFEKRKSERGVPLENWYYADRPDVEEPTYRYLNDMFNFLEKDMGLLYPWESYRQAPVIDCPFGGMETTTSTVFNDGMQCNDREFTDRNYVNVNAHELTHQWFGNYNSYTNGQNIWTSESFATYFAKKFEQHLYGDDKYQKIRHDERNSTLSAAKTDDYPVGSQKGSVARWYPKGSLVIDMLRYVMGEQEFKNFIAHYLNKHRYAVVEWNDLKVAIRESTGQTLDWFFDQWIHRGGEPLYEISWQERETKEGTRNTALNIRQAHETNALIGYFKMPVNIHVYYQDGSIDSVNTWISEAFTRIEIPNKDKKSVAFVLFDPNRNILKQVKFERNRDELFAQFSRAKNMIDRYDALTELRTIAIADKRSLLSEAFDSEKFHLIRNEIISQLAADSASLPLLIKAAADNDPLVRRALVQQIKTVPATLKPALITLLDDRSYQVILLTLELLCYHFPAEASGFLEKTNAIRGNQFENVRIKWLEMSWEYQRDSSALEQLVNFSNINRYDNPVVVQAINALKRINHLDARHLQHLISAATYWSDPVKQPAKTALTFYAEQNRYRRMIRNGIQALPAKQKEALKEIVP